MSCSKTILMLNSRLVHHFQTNQNNCRLYLPAYMWKFIFSMKLHQRSLLLTWLIISTNLLHTLPDISQAGVSTILKSCCHFCEGKIWQSNTITILLPNTDFWHGIEGAFLLTLHAYCRLSGLQEGLECGTKLFCLIFDILIFCQLITI